MATVTLTFTSEGEDVAVELRSDPKVQSKEDITSAHRLAYVAYQAAMLASDPAPGEES